VPSTDRALVTRLRNRDPAALDELYQCYHPRLYSFLARLTGRRDLAEDIFQDTWLAAARHASRLTEDTDLAAWLFTIARNRYKTHRRGAAFDHARKDRLTHEPPEPVLTPDAHATAHATATALEHALARISQSHREVLLLAALEGLDTAQIATVLDLKPDAVRQRISRARAELAEQLERANSTHHERAAGGAR